MLPPNTYNYGAIGVSLHSHSCKLLAFRSRKIGTIEQSIRLALQGLQTLGTSELQCSSSANHEGRQIVT